MRGAVRARVPDEAPSIKVRLSAMGERTRAMLEYHFEHDPRRTFEIAAGTDAHDVVIVDYDHPGTRAAIDAGRWRDGTPLVALAHGAPELDAIVVVGKPFDRAALDAAAARLRDPAFRRRAAEAARTLSELSRPPEPPGPPAPPEPSEPSGPSGPSGPPTAAAVDRSGRPSAAGSEKTSGEPPLLVRAEGVRRPSGLAAKASEGDAAGGDEDVEGARRRARVDALCGPPRTLAELDDPTDPVHRYDPDRHLVGYLSGTLATLRASERDVLGAALLLPGAELYVLPWLHRVCTSEPLTWTAAVERMFGVLDDDDVELVAYGPATVNALVARVNANAAQSYPIAAFRWLAALFSARGRLPHGADVHRPVRLRRWPEFTRLEMTPRCLDIAAEWTREPRSVESMVERLDCEPRFVTTLYAGAVATGLLEPARR